MDEQNKWTPDEAPAEPEASGSASAEPFVGSGAPEAAVPASEAPGVSACGASAAEPTEPVKPAEAVEPVTAAGVTEEPAPVEAIPEAEAVPPGAEDTVLEPSEEENAADGPVSGEPAPQETDEWDAPAPEDWGTPPPPPRPMPQPPQPSAAPHTVAWTTPGSFAAQQQAIRPPYGQPGAAPYGQSYGQPYAPPYGQPYAPPAGAQRPADRSVPPPYGQGYGQPYAPPAGAQPPAGQGAQQPYGQPGVPPYGQGYGQPYAPPVQPPVQPPQPPYGQGYGQPAPLFPPTGFGQYGAQPPKPPRRRMRTGVRVFLVILGLIALGTLVGVGVYAVQRSAANISLDDFPGYSDADDFPSFPSFPDGGGDDGGGSGDDPYAYDEDGEDPFEGFERPEVVYSGRGLTVEGKPEGDPLTAVEIYEQNVDSVVGVYAEYDGEASEGSGIVLTSDGYLVTNAHVVFYTLQSDVLVKLHDGTQYRAVVIGYDQNADLAVLRVDAQGLQPARFGDASELKVGEEVFAIGNPGGERYGSTLTGGYVSGLNRELEKSAANGLTYIQTDAAINPGNSGGPLMNAYGQVVGINSNKVVSTYYEGIGFAIPISSTAHMISDLMMQGYVSGRSRIGITGQTVTQTQSQLSGIPVGVLIVSVGDDSPLKGIAYAGDVITEADGKTITSLDDLYAVLRTHSGGDRITVTIYSAGDAETKSSSTQYTIELLADTGETQN